MSIVVHDVEQGTLAWHAARAGIPTASVFHEITRRIRGGKYSDERQRVLYTLAGERITGRVVETYSGGALARGKAMEDEARKLYLFQTDRKCERVGFVVNSEWRAGCSPDSLIGKDGGLEIKSKEPHLHIECLETGLVPEEHLPQCHGGMAITGRKWWDFVSYWPRLPIFVQRVYRDEQRIEHLRIELKRFNEQLDALTLKYTKKAA